MDKNINTRILFTVFLIFTFMQTGFAQETDIDKPKMGISIGYGNQVVKIFGVGIDLNVNYLYEVYLFEINYFGPLYSEETWSIESHARAFWGNTFYKPNDTYLSPLNSYEIGISSGFLFRKSFFDNFLKIYFSSTLGPIYTKGVPDRQFAGLMFCGNYDLGFNFKLGQNLYLDLRTGFRHISNAGLKKPNGGVNNWMVNSGVVFNL
jgi:hypothetical protein